MFMYAVHICFDAYGALLTEGYNYLYYTNNQSISCKFIRTPIYFMKSAFIKPKGHSIEHHEFFGGKCFSNSTRVCIKFQNTTICYFTYSVTCIIFVVQQFNIYIC